MRRRDWNRFERIDSDPALRVIVDFLPRQCVDVQGDGMVRERKDRPVRRLSSCRSALQRRQDPHASPAMIGLLKQNRLLPGNERVILC